MLNLVCFCVHLKAKVKHRYHRRHETETKLTYKSLMAFQREMLTGFIKSDDFLRPHNRRKLELLSVAERV